MDSSTPLLRPRPDAPSPSGAFTVVVAPEAAPALRSVPPAKRAIVERKLKAVAHVAAFRSWADTTDAQERYPLRLAGYSAEYVLDPAARTLTLLHFERRRAG